MGLIANIAGAKFGRLTVVSTAQAPHGARRRGIWWRCACSCGNAKVIYGGDIRSGDTSSCGCLDREKRAERARNRSRTHGLSRSREYEVWDSMIQRCTNPKRKDFQRYGGRGIRVCERWARSFEAFIADMGRRPEGMSIEREDSDGNYEPNNCRWATSTEQARNQKGNVVVAMNGKSQCLTAWCEELGISKATVNGRRSRGWPIEIALSTPPEAKFNWRKTRC